MTQLTPPRRIGMPHQPLPALIAAAGDKAGMRFLEFFAARIRNPNTRRAYGRAAVEFLAWCDDNQVPSIASVQPLHVAAWPERTNRPSGTHKREVQRPVARVLYQPP